MSHPLHGPPAPGTNGPDPFTGRPPSTAQAPGPPDSFGDYLAERPPGPATSPSWRPLTASELAQIRSQESHGSLWARQNPFGPEDVSPPSPSALRALDPAASAQRPINSSIVRQIQEDSLFGRQPRSSFVQGLEDWISAREQTPGGPSSTFDPGIYGGQQRPPFIPEYPGAVSNDRQIPVAIPGDPESISLDELMSARRPDDVRRIAEHRAIARDRRALATRWTQTAKLARETTPSLFGIAGRAAGRVAGVAGMISPAIEASRAAQDIGSAQGQLDAQWLRHNIPSLSQLHLNPDLVRRIMGHYIEGQRRLGRTAGSSGPPSSYDLDWLGRDTRR